mmetsp:Transcript_4209/g.10627  ORF Transcript_4209/g.10627 Transcript_4209/m.10627 type:complete len:151 (+) Transcript_4209:253-705(+)
MQSLHQHTRTATTTRVFGVAKRPGLRGLRVRTPGALSPHSPNNSDGRGGFGPETRGEKPQWLQGAQGDKDKGRDNMGKTLEATSSKVNLALNAPSCPIHLKFEKEMLSAEDGGERCLPLEVRRLAGDFVDSEECSAVPQGWWRWWRYQGL